MWYGSGSWLRASHTRGPDLILRLLMWDLWWAKWYYVGRVAQSV
jgi:hypothetical protein